MIIFPSYFFSCKIQNKNVKTNNTDTIDLQRYTYTQFIDLPKFMPFCKHSNHSGDIYWINPEDVNWSLCANAVYQGIEYTLCLSTQNIKKSGNVNFIFTTDPNFIYSGYQIGDSIKDSEKEKLIPYKSEFSKIYYLPPYNTWGAEIKNNRITHFCRLNYDGMAIDSVMESNRYPK